MTRASTGLPEEGVRPAPEAAVERGSARRAGILGIPEGRGIVVLALLLLAVAGLLVEGAWRRARAPVAAVAPVPVTSPTPRPFDPDLDKTPLSYVSDFWVQVGNRVGPWIVGTGAPGGPALVVGKGLVVTGLGASWVQPRGDAMAHLRAVDADLGIALVEIPESAMPVEALEPAKLASLHPGALVAGVTRGPDGGLRVAPGYLVSLGRGDPPSIEVSIGLPAGFGIASVVDLDGALVAIAIDAEGGTRFLAGAALGSVLDRLKQGGSCRAIEVGEPEESVRRLLKIRGGVVVERLRPESFVPAPALRSGDIVLDWNGAAVSSASQFESLIAKRDPGQHIPFRAVRGGRLVRGEVILPGPDCLPLPEPDLTLERSGLRLRWTTSMQLGGSDGPGGYVVLGVTADSPGAAAGLAPGDQIVARADLPANAAALRQALDAFEKHPRPLLLSVRRAGHARVLALEPGPKP